MAEQQSAAQGNEGRRALNIVMFQLQRQIESLAHFGIMPIKKITGPQAVDARQPDLFKMFTIIGFAVVLGAVLGGYLMEGNSVSTRRR